MKPANIYRFSLLFFTLCYFGFAKWGKNKKQALSLDNALPSQSAEQKTI